MKKKEIFSGKVRKNEYRWALPISIHILRALGINKNSKYLVGVDANKNEIIFAFKKKPIGSMQYKINMLKELKNIKDSNVLNQIEMNISRSKDILDEKSKNFLYVYTDNQAEIKSIKERMKQDKVRLTYLNSIQEANQIQKERYDKRKIKKTIKADPAFK